MWEAGCEGLIEWPKTMERALSVCVECLHARALIVYVSICGCMCVGVQLLRLVLLSRPVRGICRYASAAATQGFWSRLCAGPLRTRL